MNYPQQSYQAMDAAPAGQSNANQPPDLIAMLWRWKWLPILGVMIGSIIGLLVWVQMPPQYMAVARIQVVTPGTGSGVPMINLDYGDRGTPGRADDVVIIQSKTVLRNAIELGRLNQNPKLSDKSPDDLVNWLRKAERLTVRPGTKESATNIVEIIFRCDDAELAAEVVTAIVNGYERFISREAQLLSGEVLEKLARFRDDYDTRARVVRDQYLKTRRETPLIGIGPDVKDPYTDALLRTNEQLSVTRGRAGKIESILETVEASLNRDRGGIESLIAMVSRQINESSIRPDDPLSRESAIANYMNVGSNAEHFRVNSLQPVEIELKSLQDLYGDGHPQVRKLLKTVESHREIYAQLEAGEAEEREEKLAKLGAIKVEPLTAEDRLQTMIGSLHEELAALRREEAMLLQIASDNQAKSKEMQNAIAELDVLKNEMDSISDSASELKIALERLNMGTGYGSKIMKRLEVPEFGVLDGPHLIRYLLLSAFIGGCLFTGLAYLLELADRSYRGPDEIARDLGVPILGHIQMSALSRKDRKDEKLDLSLVTFHKAKSTASESYRGVRTAVYFGNQAGSIKVIQVTSPVPGDGKSTVAANLAIAIAQSGRRTLLLDCDMRRPRLAKLVGVRDDIGLTNVLAGKLTLEDALQTTNVPNMDILTCGRRPGNPAELLLSDDFVDVVNALREQYDYIVMDTPPILAVSDPANASACSDGVILTLRLRRNLRPIAIRAAQMLQAVNANFLGVVINGVTGRAGYGYGGYRYDGARSAAGYSGYGGYGYGATYGYGDYYTSSVADAITGQVVRSTAANGQASPNGASANGQSTTPRSLPKPGDDSAKT